MFDDKVTCFFLEGHREWRKNRLRKKGERERRPGGRQGKPGRSDGFPSIYGDSELSAKPAHFFFFYVGACGRLI